MYRVDFEARNSMHKLAHWGAIREYRVCFEKRKIPFLLAWLVFFVTLSVDIWKNCSVSSEKRMELLVFFSVIMAIIAWVLLVFPPHKTKTLDQFRRVGLVNHADETPSLIRVERDKQFPQMTDWFFDGMGIPLEVWREKQLEIETALNAAVVDITCQKGMWLIRLRTVPAEKALPKYIPWESARLSLENFVLVLGVSYTGLVCVNLAVTPHILLGGSTGSGKSMLLKLLLAQAAAKGAEIFIADFKGGVDFGPYWIERGEICTEEDHLIAMLTMLLQKMAHRRDLLKSEDCVNIDDYAKKTGQSIPRCIFACDEVAEILDKAGADADRKKKLAQIERLLSTIARQGRAFGIHLILATQRPDANILPGQIKNNLDCRICGRADKILSQIILDSTEAADKVQTDIQGRFIVSSEDGKVFQAFFFDENFETEGGDAYGDRLSSR